jgi:phage FluMu protein Com
MYVCLCNGMNEAQLMDIIERRSGSCERVKHEMGQLLLRLAPEGLELKCRRCKRIRVLRWPPPPQTEGRKKSPSSRPSNEPGKGGTA